MTNFMKRRPVRRTMALAAKLLPAAAYLRLALFLYPLFEPKRRWPRCRIRKEADSLFRLRTEDGRELYFYELRRLNRYLWPDPITHVESEMREKYESGAVRIESGDLVIDIGANIGEFALAASHTAERVVAIEPDPVAFQCLARNVAEAHDLALSDHSGWQEFYLSSRDADSSLIVPKRYNKVYSVRTVTLDEFVASNSIERIDFLKLEAEGAEPEVLAGAERALAMTRKVSIDCGPERQGEPTRDAVFEYLQRYDFEIHESGKMLYGIRVG